MLSDPPCKDFDDKFTTVPLSSLSVKYVEVIVVFLDIWVFNVNIPGMFPAVEMHKFP